MELKTLDARITKATNQVWCVVINSKDIGKDDAEKLRKDIKSNFQSVTDLIHRRSHIKSAIVESNAATKVTIDGVEMSVADAIERKSSIEYEKRLARELQKQYSSAFLEAARENKKVDLRFDDILKQLVGSDKSQISDEHRIIAETFRKNNQVEVLDPIDLRKVIASIEEHISYFEANVDVALSISNATTFIEV